MDLAVDIYRLAQAFPPEERYNLTSQVKKSVVSIPSNMAEGAGRNTHGEFNQFLGHATGSSYELETQLILSNRLGFAHPESFEDLIARLQRLQKQIYNFKQSLNR
jgi:four helix bundle protein